MRLHIEELVRRALESKKMNISDMARELNVSRVTIYNLFAGQYSRKLIQQVSHFISVPVHILMMENPTNGAEFDQNLVRAYHASTLQTKQSVGHLLNLKGTPSLDARKPKIIVVDDIKENVELLVRLLRKDFEVLDFTDPLQALQAIRKDEVDAIITDQRMPQMTGTALLKEARALGRSALKFIVSGYTDKDGLIEAINDAHADAFFVKPFKPMEIREKIQALLVPPHVN